MFVLAEFDDSPEAIINPKDLHEPIPDFPKVAVSCFARETFRRMVEAFDGQVIAQMSMVILKSWFMRLRFLDSD